MNDAPIENFARVDDHLWRGARPNHVGAIWLVSQGVRTIINLEWLHDDHAVFGPAIDGLVYLRLRDWEPVAAVAPWLEDRHIRSFLAAVRTSPGPIYVHCRDGQNRTGLAVAAYRLIIKDDPLDVVLAELASYQGLWAEPDAAYIRSLASRRADF